VDFLLPCYHILMQHLCASGKATARYSQEMSVLERTQEGASTGQMHVISQLSYFSVQSAVIFQADTFYEFKHSF